MGRLYEKRKQREGAQVGNKNAALEEKQLGQNDPVDCVTDDEKNNTQLRQNDVVA